ncbi:unnamed protein product [Ceratitis capitata]|uniref:(Mediterranean fruit fly) hypothetical protein n=1 Tax=Ceratitis capitata TaxID=7213 RepID=A0A811V4S4_CERCA|nr:unnamed protein product [Ceratitis capitata]
MPLDADTRLLGCKNQNNACSKSEQALKEKKVDGAEKIFRQPVIILQPMKIKKIEAAATSPPAVFQHTQKKKAFQTAITLTSTSATPKQTFDSEAEQPGKLLQQWQQRQPHRYAPAPLAHTITHPLALSGDSIAAGRQTCKQTSRQSDETTVSQATTRQGKA